MGDARLHGNLIIATGWNDKRRASKGMYVQRNWYQRDRGMAETRMSRANITQFALLHGAE